ncbi:hypothetical protein BDN72DRAFT_866341, partial [Pluteus cervinus]
DDESEAIPVSSEELNNTTGSAKLPLPKAEPLGDKFVDDGNHKPQDSSNQPNTENEAVTTPTAKLKDAKDGAELALSGMKGLGDKPRGIVDKLNAISAAVKYVAEIHPYAQKAADILFSVTKFIGKQVELDEKIKGLIDLVDKVYLLVDGSDKVKRISEGHKGHLEALATETIEVATLIQQYASKTPKFWKRLVKSPLSNVGSQIQKHKEIIKDLRDAIQQFSTLQIQLNTERIELALKGSMKEIQQNSVALEKIMEDIRQNSLALEKIMKDIQQNSILSMLQLNIELIGERQILDGLPHVKGAGYSLSKQCLRDTRVDTINEILGWAMGTTKSRVLWLSGGARTGKSTIAHTTSGKSARL